jgi:hypothetical protein
MKMDNEDKKKIHNSNIKIQTRGSPQVSPSTIELADWCARELWRGYKYHNGKRTISDDKFLYIFSTPSQKYLNGYTKSINIKVLEIKRLIAAAQIRKGKRKNNLRLINGIRTLAHQIDNYYHLYFQNHKTDLDFFEIPSILTYEVGRDFYKGKVKNPVNGCHAALASRLLFYAIPEFPIFNYSTNLANALGIKGASPAITINPYFNIIANGYCNHWQELEKYQMPLSLYLDDDYWLKIKNSGWWQRRIYDISLLLHFQLYDASIFLKSVSKNSDTKYV